MSKPEYKRLAVQIPDVVKTIRNQVIDEAIDAVKDESIGRCTDSEKEYLDDILKALAALKTKR